MTVRFCDEFDGGFGWIFPDELYQRCSHALVADGRVWAIDPVDGDGVEERIRSAGEPSGVIQLLDRHNRDCRRLAERLHLPLHVVPIRPVDDAPFEFIVVVNAWKWKEVALWWPEQRLLVCADVLGTAPGERAGTERVAVHPLLRIVPPRRQLRCLDPQIVLCGHGEGLLADAGPSFREALSTARRRIPRALASAVRARLP